MLKSSFLVIAWLLIPFIINSCQWRNNKGEFSTENGIDIEVFDLINRDGCGVYPKNGTTVNFCKHNLI
jgi:hypothetical protein